MKRKWLSGARIICIIAIFLCASPLWANEGPLDHIPAEMKDQQYRVSPGDLIEIDVFEVEELSRTIRVRSNGYIALPLIGSIEVQGLTERQLEIALAVLLQERYLHDPQVSVFVKESGFFYVLGRVQNKEGIFPYRPGITLQQAIAMSGAFPGEDSGIKEVQVTRTLESGKKKTYIFDYDGITRGALGSIPIMREDVIFVKGLGKLYVIGEVERPGGLNVRPDMKVQQAIAFAGGLSSVSKGSRIQIKRTDRAGNISIRTLNFKRVNDGKADDIDVMEGDIIYVPKSYLKSMVRGFFFTLGIGDGTVGVRPDTVLY